MRHSIVILIPWFGPWPEWIDFFVESCRANRDVNWVLITDQSPPENSAPNVRFLRTSFADYKARISDTLAIRFDPSEPYKLCDIRPALGEIHADLIRGYGFFGFGDLDLVYGDIRETYDAEALDIYDAFSSHPERCSGHLFLMRNTPAMVSAFRSVWGWRRRMEQDAYNGFDEAGFYNLFRGRSAKLLGMLGRRNPRGLFREAYTSPVPGTDMRWYWRDGKLTNQFYPHRGFIYLHFAHWRGNRWYAWLPHIAPGTPAPWSRLDRIVQMDWRDARENGFMISPAGIQPIEEARHD